MSRASRHVICRFVEIPDPGARGFSLPGARFPDEYFLVRRGGAVYAYRNVCPHAGSFLNWKPDAFLTRDQTLIMCSAHGALYHPDTGACAGGPCNGASLSVLPVAIERGEVVTYIRESGGGSSGES